MEEIFKKSLDMFVRYSILAVASIGNLWIFYAIFTPITISAVYFLFNLFFETVLAQNVIIVKEAFFMEIIPACVAGSAYFLLLILNLSVPLSINKRLKMLLFSFVILLTLNIVRIFSLGLMFIHCSLWFDLTHKIFWYFGSIIFVVGIWFLEVKIFHIKEIPFYSDIKYFYQAIKLNK